MRTFLLALFSALGLCLASQAQPSEIFSSAHSKFRLVYRLSAGEVYDAKGRFQYPAIVDRKPYDTLRLDLPVDTYLKTQPKGHYLFAVAWRNEVIKEYRQTCAYQVQRLKDGQNTRIVVYDSMGTPTSTPQLTHRNKSIKYSETQKSYFRTKNLKSGMLTLMDGKDTFFFTDYPEGYGYWRGNDRKRRWLGKKFRQTRSLHINRPRRYGPRGYIASNQPVYRIGDTVKIKAYVLRRNGKPYTKPLKFSLVGSHYPYEGWVNKELTPVKPGVFTYEFTVPDSIKIDKDYTLNLRKQRSKQRYYYSGRLTSNKIRIEDYQLDEATVALVQEQTVFHQGDTVRFTIRAFDANQLPLRDAKARITINHKGANPVYTGCVSVPLILYSEEVSLDAEGITQVMIPDSIFSHELRQWVEIECQINTAANEIHETTGRLTYDPRKEAAVPVLKLDDQMDQVAASGSEQKSTFTWRNGSEVIQKVISSEPIPVLPGATALDVKNGQDQQSVLLSTWDHKVLLGHNRTSDSVSFSCLNPRKLDVHYQLYRGEWLLESGIIQDHHRWQYSTENALPYSLQVEFVWSGQTNVLTERAYLKDRDLHVKVNEPAKIFPGQKQDVQVSVTDYKNEPVADADILAYAVNTTFQDQNTPHVPTFTTRRYSTRFLSQYTYGVANGPSYRSVVSDKNLTTFGLTDQLYYQLIASDKALFNYAHDKEEETQFTVHVFQNHRAQLVHLIYVDDEPYHWNESTSYASMRVTDEPHDIRIRLRNQEITLTDFVFEAGKKNELCINLDEESPEVVVKRRRKKMRRAELRQLENYLIDANYSHNIILASNRVGYLKDGYYGSRIVGPFDKNDTVKITNRDGVSETLICGSSQRIRIPRDNSKSSYTILAYGDDHHLHRWFRKLSGSHDDSYPERFHQWSPKTVSFPDQKSYGSPKAAFENGDSRLTLPIGPRSFISAKLCKTGEDCKEIKPTYYSDDLTINSLSAGTYRLEMHFWGEEVEITDIVIAEGTATYLDLDLPCNRIKLHKKRVHSGTWTDGKYVDILNGHAMDLGRVTALPYYSGTAQEVNLYRQAFFFKNLPDGRYFLNYNMESHPSTYLRAEGTNYFNLGTLYCERDNPYGYYYDQNVVTRRYYHPQALTGISMNSRGARMFAVEGRVRSNMRSWDDMNPYRGNELVIEEGYGGVDHLSFYLDTVRKAEFTLSKAPSSLRSRFTDYAFWQPTLSTNPSGVASFKAHFPDDITQWETHYLVMGDKKSGTYQGSIKSYLPVSANLRTPRFLVAGDQSEVVLQDLNYSGDSLRVRPSIDVNGARNTLRSYVLNESHVQTASITGWGDSLNITYRLDTDYDFFDGESRDIPVYPKGIEEKKGYFMVLEDDSQTTLSFDPALGTITLYVSPNPLDELAKSVDALKNYRHACNEQLASKLLAYLVEEKLRKKDGLGNFNSFRIKGIINRLENNYQKNEGWAWFNDRGRVTPWVSHYVTRALITAHQAGYNSKLLYKALDDIENHLKGVTHDGTKVTLLYLLAEAKRDFNYHEVLVSINVEQLNAYQKVLLERVKQLRGLDFSIRLFIRSGKRTATGMLYWGDENQAFYCSALPASVVAYDILKHAFQFEFADDVALWLLHQRRNGAWANTHHTALSLLRLVDHFKLTKDDLGVQNFMQYRSGGEEWKKLTTSVQLPATSSIEIRKKNGMPLFFTAYQSQWNPEPLAKTEIAEFTLSFRNQDEVLTALENGMPTQMRLHLNVKQAAEYCMVSVPIPAGCSYGKKVLPAWHSHEVHREYFRDRVVIYYQSLPVGTYDMEIQLEPRFKGQYYLNPCQLELMYFPTLSANNQGSILRIE